MTNKPDDTLICAVCSGESTGVSVDVYSLCDHPRCSEVAKAWRNKGYGRLSHIERQAMQLAGKAGGAFLMNELGGQTDLAKMTAKEWDAFIEEIIDRYRASIQELADDGIPF